MLVFYDRSLIRDGGFWYFNIFDNFILLFYYDKMKNLFFIKFFKCDFDFQRKELLIELYFILILGLWINLYEKNYNEREKKNEMRFLFFNILGIL